jgi:two-component system, NarL family, response regulator NreC
VSDPIKVLLVEDFSITIKFLSQALRASRSSIVYTAVSGAQALQLLCNNGPMDILLVDLVMSGMSGVELIKKVRDLEQDFVWNRERIVAMSAEVTLRDEALQAGADEFLDKFSSPIKHIIRIIDEITIQKRGAESTTKPAADVGGASTQT